MDDHHDEHQKSVSTTITIEGKQGSQIPSSASTVPEENEKKFTYLRCLPCDPNRNLHRYVILCFICMLTLGSYYCYENMTSLHGTLRAVMQIDDAQYEILNSVYSWPNVIVPVLGGILIDRVLGIRVAMVFFCTLISVGQLIVSIGGFLNCFWVIVVGRFVFGLGGENLLVAIFTYCVMWFKPTQINTVFGFLLCAARTGSIMDLSFTQKLYDALKFGDVERIQLGSTLMVGFGFCVFSLFCAIVFGVFDKRAEKILMITQVHKESEPLKTKKEKITIRDIKDFPWLIFIICVVFYVTILPFVGLAMMFLITKYGLSSSDANFVGSLMYIVPTIAFPVVGILVDKIGFNLIWLNLGIVIALVAHSIFAFLPNHVVIPYIAMSLIGIAYGIFACVIWPLIAFTVSDYQLGTAYGIMLAVQNLGITIVTIVVSIIEVQYGYLLLEIMFLALLFIALTFGVVLYIWDSNSSGGTLNMSGRVRAKLYGDSKDEQVTSSRISASQCVTWKDDVIHSLITKTEDSTFSLWIRNTDSKIGAVK